MDPLIAHGLLIIKKTPVNWSGFHPRSNHKGHIIGSAILKDASGIFIPGLTLDIEVKAAIVAPVCLMQFSMKQKAGKTKEVVYQLEVTPVSKLSHNGARGRIYGPHEHIGCYDEPIAVTEKGVDCSNWNACLMYFFNKTNIAPFDIDSPC